MRLELDHLKQDLQSHKTSTELFRHSATHNIGTMHMSKPDPLHFVFKKLEKFLLAPPSIAGSERRGTGVSMKQQIFLCTTDCVLKSLDAIIHLVHSAPGKDAEISPGPDQNISTIPDEVAVKFGTLQQLLTFYAPLRKSSVMELSVMSKY